MSTDHHTQVTHKEGSGLSPGRCSSRGRSGQDKYSQPQRLYFKQATFPKRTNPAHVSAMSIFLNTYRVTLPGQLLKDTETQHNSTAGHQHTGTHTHT